MHILISTLLAAPAFVAATSAADASSVSVLANEILHSLGTCEAQLSARTLDAALPLGPRDLKALADAPDVHQVASATPRQDRVAIFAEPHRLCPDGPVGVKFKLAKVLRQPELTRFESHLLRNQLLAIVETSLRAAEIPAFDDARVHVVPAEATRDKGLAVVSAAFWLDAAALPPAVFERVLVNLRGGEYRTAALSPHEPTPDEFRIARRVARNRAGELLDSLPAHAAIPAVAIDEPELPSRAHFLARWRSRGTQIVGGSATQPTHLLILAEPRRLPGDHPGVGVRLTLGRSIPRGSAGRFTVDLVRNQMLVVLERALRAVSLAPFDDPRVLIGFAAAVADEDEVFLSVPVWVDAAQLPPETVERLVLRLHTEEHDLARTLNL